ncbi:hypothetical protein [Xanthobacter sp. VNH20]|uniref:UGSC family (seleno)protein n=1 Tax=Xanthobacter sp. VNH20 TaxID=3156616 RepID=UPI0032B60E83
MKEFDERGLPGCFVVTTEFYQGAVTQMAALGYEAAIIWAPHPIQNKTPEELDQIADSLMDQIISAICTQPKPE